MVLWSLISLEYVIGYVLPRLLDTWKFFWNILCWNCLVKATLFLKYELLMCWYWIICSRWRWNRNRRSSRCNEVILSFLPPKFLCKLNLISFSNYLTFTIFWVSFCFANVHLVNCKCPLKISHWRYFWYLFKMRSPFLLWLMYASLDPASQQWCFEALFGLIRVGLGFSRT